MAWVVVLVTGAAAQEAGRLDELVSQEILREGDGIYVTDVEGNRRKGRIKKLSAAVLSVTNGRDVWTFAPGEIGEIERQDSLANGIWTGVAVGFGVFTMTCRDYDAPGGICPYVYALIGGWPLAAGAALGAVFDAHITESVYRSATGGRAGLAPLVLEEGVGVRLVVTW